MFQAVINTDNGKCIIVQASPTSTPAVEDTERVPATAANNNHETEQADNLPVASAAAASKAPPSKSSHKDNKHDGDKTNQNDSKDFPKRGEKFVSSSAAAAAAASNSNNQSGNDRNKHVKGKDGPGDARKMDFAATRAPEDKSMQDNQGENKVPTQFVLFFAR